MVVQALLQYRAGRWFLFDGRRLTVAGVVLAAMFGTLLLVDPIDTITDENITPLFYAFSALLGGNLNLLTIVVSVNQLAFSRGIKSTGELRSEIENVGQLRRSVAEAAGHDVVPRAPAGFLRVVLDELGRDLETLSAGIDRNTDTRTGTDADTELLVGMLSEQRHTVEDRLAASHTKTVDVLAATLAIDVATARHLADRARTRGGGRLAQSTRDALEGVSQRLEQLVLVRNHFESMYTQENLAKMSRQLLFVGVPVEFVLALGLLWFVGALSVVSPVALPVVFVYLCIVLGLAPLAVVFAFVVRAVTISRQTAATTHFSPQRQATRMEEDGPVGDGRP